MYSGVGIPISYTQVPECPVFKNTYVSGIRVPGYLDVWLTGIRVPGFLSGRYTGTRGAVFMYTAADILVPRWLVARSQDVQYTLSGCPRTRFLLYATAIANAKIRAIIVKTENRSMRGCKKGKDSITIKIEHYNNFITIKVKHYNNLRKLHYKKKYCK